MTENKIARICWNTYGWRKPSGRTGKSKNKKAYEYLVGYGHEEWLLDTTKLIDGWHYAYLQPIGLHHSKYIGQTFNISLYSINEETRTRWWVGAIRNVTVITKDQSAAVYKTYKKKGWLREMEEQLRNVGARVSDFQKVDPKGFAVLRFRPKSLKLWDTPLEFPASDPAIKATYYILLNQIKVPKLQGISRGFEFSPGHKPKKRSAKSTYEAHSSEVDLTHNKIQTNIYNQLARKYGKKNVGTEKGVGSQIDVVLKNSNGSFNFYEIKTSYSVRLCIREALGQLLEYAYYGNANEPSKLIVVSENLITPEARSYLQTLRKRFSIPIHYQRYDPEKEALEETIH